MTVRQRGYPGWPLCRNAMRPRHFGSPLQVDSARNTPYRNARRGNESLHPGAALFGNHLEQVFTGDNFLKVARKLGISKAGPEPEDHRLSAAPMNPPAAI